MTVGQDQAGPLTSVMMTGEEVGVSTMNMMTDTMETRAFVMMRETDMEEEEVSVMMIGGTGKAVGRMQGTETAMRNAGTDVIVSISGLKNIFFYCFSRTLLFTAINLIKGRPSHQTMLRYAGQCQYQSTVDQMSEVYLNQMASLSLR